MANKDLTKQDISHLAKLASLTLSEQEIAKFETQLTDTLHFVENLHELDTSAVSPTNHTTDLKNVMFEDGTENDRKFTQKQALANAKDTKNNEFQVKRIIF